MDSISNIDQLISYIRKLSEEAVGRLLATVIGILKIEDIDIERCPYCGSVHFVRFGKKRGKQRYLCNECKRTFVTTTNTIMSMSHCSAPIWKEVISDTLTGNAIDFTARRLQLSHACVFDMRHKFLLTLQDVIKTEPVVLENVCELDETFVLECCKGKELPGNVNREPRKHGAKAQKHGISDEYVCINTGVQRDGGVVAEAVNRAKPDNSELEQVYTGHIGKNSLLLCNGMHGYASLAVLNGGCTVQSVDKSEEETSFFNLNTVNNFHSFIKNRYIFYRGVATKYLNRYNVLFTLAWRQKEDVLASLYKKLLNPSGINYHHTINDVRTLRLLEV